MRHVFEIVSNKDHPSDETWARLRCFFEEMETTINARFPSIKIQYREEK